MSLTWLGIGAVIFLALGCWMGYRRGFIKEVVSTLFVVLSIALVWVINPYVNRFLRENTPVYETIRKGCDDLVNSQAENLKGLNASEQTSVLEELPLPDFLISALKENNTAEIYRYLSADTFVEYLSGYLSAIIVNGLSFLLSFVLATLLIRMLSYALNIIARLPVLNGANRVAGALMGVIKGVLFIWIAFLLVTIFCSTEAGGYILNMIRKDPFLNFLYENDILVRIFMNIFYGNA